MEIRKSQQIFLWKAVKKKKKEKKEKEEKITSSS